MLFVSSLTPLSVFASSLWLKTLGEPVICEVEDERVKKAEPKDVEGNKVQVEEELMELVEE